MPLSLTISEGALPVGSEKKAIKQLTESFLKHHKLAGNKVMTPNVTANVSIIKDGFSFSGGQEFKGVWVEWKVPSFAFADEAIQKAFGKDTTDIIEKLSGGKQNRSNIYFNVVHTVDGSWNMDGKAMTNEELGVEISKG